MLPTKCWLTAAIVFGSLGCCSTSPDTSHTSLRSKVGEYALKTAAEIPLAIISGALDRATETEEERHIRKDKERCRKGQALKHHTDKKELQGHESWLESREWFREKGFRHPQLELSWEEFSRR